MNLANNLLSAADRFPRRVALRTEDADIDYATFLARANRVAAEARSIGIRKGSMVGLIAPNGFAFPVAFYSMLMIGATTVPMNPLLAERELKYYLTDTAAELVIVEKSMMEKVSSMLNDVQIKILVLDEDGLVVGSEVSSNGAIEVCDCEEDHTALVLYTSGTTGQPKGAMLTHKNLSSNAATTVETLHYLRPDDVLIGCLPLFHVFALSCVLNAAVTAGASVSFMARFESEAVLERIKRDKVTVFTGVPTMYVALLNCAPGQEPTSLRTAVCGGAPMPVEVIQQFERRFNCPIYEAYGLSETSPMASFNRPETGKRAGSVGLPVRGMEMRLIDDDGKDVAADAIGEIAIRGDGVMKGYLNRPDATADAIKDGWFKSGDFGRRDADGFYYVVDRKKRMIIRGGYNVYPREIEDILYEIPSIMEVAVIGIKDPYFGEEVGAAVVMREGHELNAPGIQEFCKVRLSPYKYPRVIWAVDSLPKTAAGKILHREVQAPEQKMPINS